MIRRPPRSTLFPYTTLFRSLAADLDRTTSQLAALTVPDDLLAAGPEIERLFKRLGSHEKAAADTRDRLAEIAQDRKSTRLNSSHANTSYAVFCLKKKKTQSP